VNDLAKPETRVAISARGEIVHVMLVEPLLKRNLEFDSMTVIEMPGSGARVSALLSDRIDAGNVHFDQVAAIADQGNFQVLIEPWKEFAGWTNEVWVVRSEWLQDPDNERALVDVLKSTLMAFRRANDFDWYLERYRKYATLKGAPEETAEHLRPIWERLQGEIGAWPEDMNFTVAEFESLVPAYKAAGAIRGTVPIEDIVEPKYLQQALAELG
jgi:NitT/TauT family transport system substrate-binding protein